MKDLLEALAIFAKYMPENGHSVFHCEHDTLYVMCPSPENANMPKSEVDRLDEIGFFWNEDDDSWQSFRYGSS